MYLNSHVSFVFMIGSLLLIFMGFFLTFLCMISRKFRKSCCCSCCSSDYSRSSSKDKGKIINCIFSTFFEQRYSSFSSSLQHQPLFHHVFFTIDLLAELFYNMVIENFRPTDFEFRITNIRNNQ
jgi:hypothetical protein